MIGALLPKDLVVNVLIDISIIAEKMGLVNVAMHALASISP